MNITNLSAYAQRNLNEELKKIRKERINIILRKIPSDVIAEIKDCLSCSIECHVWFEYGKYHVTGGIGIKSHYAPDHEVIGCFVPDDLK